MRWFHVIKKQPNNRNESLVKESDTKANQPKNEVLYPMKLEVIHRKLRDFRLGK